MFVRTLFFLILLTSPLMIACSQNGKIDRETPSPIAKQNEKQGSGPLITLDPGHGGWDFGATSNNVEEKMIALRTAVLLKQFLSNKGYRVILTRSQDIFIPLKARSTIANDTKSKLLVSLHYNAFSNPNTKGIEIYYYDKGAKWKRIASKKLAELVLSSLLHRTGAASRGVKHGNFHIVRETEMPAILIEGGFITNPQERDQLNDQKYLSQLAKAIAEGIEQYFH